MSEDLAKLIDQTEGVLGRQLTYRETIGQVRYLLTGPKGSQVIRESVTKKPSKKVLEMHRKIHDALVLLRDSERPPYPAHHIVGEKLEKIFWGQDRRPLPAIPEKLGRSNQVCFVGGALRQQRS